MAASNSNKSPPEPVWVSAMPAATGLWSMILTFRWKYFVGRGGEVVCLVLIIDTFQGVSKQNLSYDRKI